MTLEEARELLSESKPRPSNPLPRRDSPTSPLSSKLQEQPAAQRLLPPARTMAEREFLNREILRRYIQGSMMNSSGNGVIESPVSKPVQPEPTSTPKPASTVSTTI